MGMVPPLIAAPPSHEAAASAAPSLARWEFVEPHMGTLFRIVIFAPEIGPAKTAARAAFAQIARLNTIMSDYDPDSEVMRLCRQPAGVGATVSPELGDILARSQQLAEATSGAFDVTLGPVILLWREARRGRRLPSLEERQAARALSGYQKLVIGPDAQTATLRSRGMRIDLGGIAKGYAADSALEILNQQGFRRAMVAASGDLALGDAPPDEAGWKITLTPFGEIRGAITVVATNIGISTSGDTEQFLELGGVRYSHVVDPATGLGLTKSVAVTVLASRGSLADGLATACSVLSLERVERLASAWSEPVRILVHTREGRQAVERHVYGTDPIGLISPL